MGCYSSVEMAVATRNSESVSNTYKRWPTGREVANGQGIVQRKMNSRASGSYRPVTTMEGDLRNVRSLLYGAD